MIPRKMGKGARCNYENLKQKLVFDLVKHGLNKPIWIRPNLVSFWRQNRRGRGEEKREEEEEEDKKKMKGRSSSKAKLSWILAWLI